MVGYRTVPFFKKIDGLTLGIIFLEFLALYAPPLSVYVYSSAWKTHTVKARWYGKGYKKGVRRKSRDEEP